MNLPPASRPEVAGLLEQATRWRATSWLLRAPDRETAEALRALSAALPGTSPGADLLREIAAEAGPGTEAEYHRVLGPGGACPAGESDWSQNVLGAKGGILGDVAAFYRAFRFDPAAEIRESPDHVAVEASFLAWLLVKEAYAVHSDLSEEAAICRDAREKFAGEHFLPLLREIAPRLEAQAASAFYAKAGSLLALWARAA